MGVANSIRLNTSGVGVMMAARMKIPRIAYRLWLMMKEGVTILSKIKRKITTGNSNTQPTPRVTFTNKLKYSVIDTIATT